MKIDLREGPCGVMVVTIEGDVDLSTSPEVRKALAPLFRRDLRHLIVDLSGVPYMDSSGIATLIEGLQLSMKGSIRLTLVGLQPRVEAAFELAHLKDVFTIRDRLEDALNGSVGP